MLAGMTPSRRRSPTWTLAHLGFPGLSKRVLAGVNDNNLSGYSAQLAYYFFLSLFPSLLFLTTLLGFLPIAHRGRLVMQALTHTLPNQALSLVRSDLIGLVHQHKSGLLSFSVAFALYSAANAITAVSTGLNQAYGVREGRPYWRVLLMALGLTLALTLIILLGAAIFFLGPFIGHIRAARADVPFLAPLIDILRWPLLLFAAILAIALIYYFTPNVRQEWRWLTPGSVFAVLGWLAASLLFAFYVNHFGSYNKTYGSIGAVIVILTWMYLGGFVLLVGGQINAVIKIAAEGRETKTEAPRDGHDRRP